MLSSGKRELCGKGDKNWKGTTEGLECKKLVVSVEGFRARREVWCDQDIKNETESGEFRWNLFVDGSVSKCGLDGAQKGAEEWRQIKETCTSYVTQIAWSLDRWASWKIRNDDVTVKRNWRKSKKLNIWKSKVMGLEKKSRECKRSRNYDGKCRIVFKKLIRVVVVRGVK